MVKIVQGTLRWLKQLGKTLGTSQQERIACAFHFGGNTVAFDNILIVEMHETWLFSYRWLPNLNIEILLHGQFNPAV
jgi:hypothetical protein